MTETHVLEVDDRAACHRAAIGLAVARLGCDARELALRHLATGRPYLEVRRRPAKLHISISRAGRHAAVALSDEPAVGVDMERVIDGRHLDGLLVRRTFAAAELGREMPGASEFTAVWTRKEAALKAMGTGLAIEPRNLRLPAAQLGVTAALTLPNGNRAAMTSWDLGDGLMLSVCSGDLRVAEPVIFSPKGL